MAIGLVAIPHTAPAQTQADEPAGSEIGQVRSRHLGLRAVITTASDQSPTFRRMVEAINASNGIVYIDPGACRRGARACLVKVTSAGRHRYVFVKVSISHADLQVMALIGHELRHAIEVLSDPTVTNTATLHSFYELSDGRVGSTTRIETRAAIEAGDAVADEIGRFQRAIRNRAR